MTEAFYDCGSLTGVSIPVSVTTIGEDAFSGCNSLTDVRYAGTPEQWEQIDIGPGNERLKVMSMLNVSVAFENASGDAVDSLEDLKGQEEFTANVEIEEASVQAYVEDRDLAMINIFAVIYNRRGAMAHLQQWEVNVADDQNVYSMTNIRIPPDVQVGAIRILVMSDRYVPLALANGL